MSKAHPSKIKENDSNRKQGRFPPSRHNICSSCKQDIGVSKQIARHRCEK